MDYTINGHESFVMIRIKNKCVFVSNERDKTTFAPAATIPLYF